MDLLTVLTYIATGGGALLIAYQITERWPWATQLDPEPRRWAANAIAGVFGMLAWLLQMGLGAHPQPTDWQGWVSVLSLAFITAGWLGDKVHGRVKLSQYTRNGDGERVAKQPYPYRPH